MRTTGALVLSLALVACGSVSRTEPDASGDPIDAAIDAAIDAPIDAPSGLTLTSIAPTAGIVTTQVTLRGEGFGAAQGTVTVGGADAAVVTWSATEIVARIPDLYPGEVEVTVTAQDATSGALTFRVILPPRAYVHNAASDPATGNDSVTVLAFDPVSGALTQQGDPVTVGAAPSSFGGCASSLRLHEGTRRLFVSAGSRVASYAIDPVTGGLTPVAGSPFQVGGTRIFGVDVTADGDRLFVPDINGTIIVANISATGALTPIAGSPFNANAPSTDIPMLSRNGRFLYVNTESNMRFAGLSVAATGALTPLAGNPFQGSQAFGAAMRPGHDQFYIPDGANLLRGWSYDPNTGAPTLIAGAPWTVPATGGTFHFPAFTADGGRLYVGTWSNAHVYGFDLDAAGVPTPIAGSPWNFTATLASISCMAVSKDGQFLVVNNAGRREVAVMRLDAAGVPAHVTGSPFSQTTPAEDASGLALTF